MQKRMRAICPSLFAEMKHDKAWQRCWEPELLRMVASGAGSRKLTFANKVAEFCPKKIPALMFFGQESRNVCRTLLAHVR